MHEDVFAGLGGDEAVALVGVEPFHGSNRHGRLPSLHRLGGIDQRRTYLAPTARDKLALRVAKQSVNLWQATVAATAGHRASGHAERQDDGCAQQVPERATTRSVASKSSRS